MFRRRMLTPLAVALVLTLTACADRSGPIAPADPTAAAVGDGAGVAVAAGAASRLPNTTYTMTLAAGEIPPFIPPEVADLLVGDWELDFTDSRHSIARLNGDVMAEGPYVATPTRLVGRDVSGPLACVGPGFEQGVYGWRLDNGELTLTVVQDRCDGRALVLTAKPWAMQ